MQVCCRKIGSDRILRGVWCICASLPAEYTLLQRHCTKTTDTDNTRTTHRQYRQNNVCWSDAKKTAAAVELLVPEHVAAQHTR